jgi:hypothetical protein
MSASEKAPASTEDDPQRVASPVEQEALRRLQQIDQPAFDAFVAEFGLESDRAAAILGAAKLDELLRRMLDRFFVPDPHKKYGLLGNSGDQALSSFSARTKAAFRLGLIDEEFALSLDIIRKIRNRFAHEVEAGSLAEEPYREWVKELARPIPSPTFWRIHVERFGKTGGPAAEFRAVLVVLTLILEQSINLVSRVRTSAFLPTMTTGQWRAGRGRPAEG